MADDHNQRPYRANEAPSRAGGSGSAASDPLAELARLIGQNDPFSEFGQSGRRAAAQQAAPQQAAPQQAAPSVDWPPATAPRQQFGSAPLAAGPGVYQIGGQVGRQAGQAGHQANHNAAGHDAAGYDASAYEAPAYEVPGYGAPGYRASGFPAAPEEAGYEHGSFPSYQQAGEADDDYDEEAPPRRRRFGVLAIAAVFALAVVGTAGAFGYRAIFGSSSMSGPPPVIKAETTPSKIVPASAGKDTQAAKMITDRANDRGMGEKLVSREEQPIAVTPERSADAAFPPAANVAPFAQTPQTGSGVIGAEPKKIRTISIRPDGTAEPTSSAALPAPAESPTAQPRVVNITPARSSPPPAAPARVNDAPQPEPVAEPTRAAPPSRATAAPRQPEPATANAPLSLDPNTSSASAPARGAPQRTAVASPPARVAPAASSGGSGGYAVQVSARKSEGDAQAALRQLQAKYPSQLGGRPSMIKRVDLGAKGIYFRAMVGPFGSSSEASSLCTSLKSAGGQCMVQKN